MSRLRLFFLFFFYSNGKKDYKGESFPLLSRLIENASKHKVGGKPQKEVGGAPMARVVETNFTKNC